MCALRIRTNPSNTSSEVKHVNHSLQHDAVLLRCLSGVVSALTCFSSGSNTKQRAGALSAMRDAARMLALEPGVESSAAHVQFGWALADKSDGLWQYLVKRKMLDGNARECKRLSLCPLILLYMSPHTPLYASALILLYMCSHTPLYVPSYCRMCPHTAVHVSPYCCICALILLLQTCQTDYRQTLAVCPKVLCPQAS